MLAGSATVQRTHGCALSSRSLGVTSPRTRVLVLVPGRLDSRVSGPEIRAWEFAKALAGEFDVTAAARTNRIGVRDGVHVVPWSRRRLLREARRHDVVLSSCLPPFLLVTARASRLATIADLYDPLELELATLQPSRSKRRAMRSRLAINALQLRHADLVVCASSRQRDELLHAAARLQPPRAAALDPIVVPFGVADPPPRAARRPLRERFPQIASDDTLVLWWGSVWRWLDAETAIRAFQLIARSRSDVKLVIAAGRRRHADTARFDALDDAHALAESIGVLNRNVFFLDDWIPYAERHEYLCDADLGLTLHRHRDEARLAARARYMDYLWTALPPILARGDELADELEAAGFARLIAPGEPQQLARAVIALADAPDAVASARRAGRALAAKRNWRSAGAELAAVVREAAGSRSATRDGASGALSASFRYYALQIADRIAV